MKEEKKVADGQRQVRLERVTVGTRLYGDKNMSLAYRSKFKSAILRDAAAI